MWLMLLTWKMRNNSHWTCLESAAHFILISSYPTNHEEIILLKAMYFWDFIILLISIISVAVALLIVIKFYKAIKQPPWKLKAATTAHCSIRLIKKRETRIRDALLAVYLNTPNYIQYDFFFDCILNISQTPFSKRIHTFLQKCVYEGGVFNMYNVYYKYPSPHPCLFITVSTPLQHTTPKIPIKSIV